LSKAKPAIVFEHCHLNSFVKMKQELDSTLQLHWF